MCGFMLVLPLFLLIIVGCTLKNRGFFNAADIKTLTKTLYWVILPALLFRASYMSGHEVLKKPMLLVAYTLCYTVTVVLSWSVSAFFSHRDDRKKTAASTFTSIRSNNSYLGLPVVFLLGGEAALHNASIYLAVSTIPLNIFSLSSAEIILSGRISLLESKNIARRVVLNPLLLSCLFGILAAIAGPERLPNVIDEPLKLLTSAATAIALIALGGSLDLTKIVRITETFRETWVDCVIRLGVNPAIMWMAMRAFNVDTPMLQVSVILSAMPAAVNSFIVAKEMNMDADHAATIVAVSTAAGMATISLWASALGMT